MFSYNQKIRVQIKIGILFILSFLLFSCIYPSPIDKYKEKENFKGRWESNGGCFILKSDGTFTYSVNVDYLDEIEVPRNGTGTWDFDKSKKNVNIVFTMPTKSGDSTLLGSNIFCDWLEYSEDNSEPFAFAIMGKQENSCYFYHKK